MPSLKLTPQQLKEAQAAFYVIDIDHNGTISFEELSKMFADSGANLDTEQLKAAFEAVDHNGDGIISFEEFVNALL